MHWIVVTLKPNQSKRAEENLNAQTIKCFFPKLSLIRNQKKVVESLFPGYGFVKLNDWNQLRPVSATKGISKVLSFDSRIPTVHSSINANIKKSLELVVNDEEGDDIDIDDNVIIGSGLFEGKEAKVVDMLDRSGSHIFLLKIFDHPKTIWFNSKGLSLINNPLSKYKNL